MNLARNWQLVRHTETALRTGNESLGNVPALLRSLLSEQAWREFVLPNGETVSYRRLGQFVAAAPPRGLGTEMAVVERIVGTGDLHLLGLLHEAKKGRVGRPRRGEETATESVEINSSNATSAVAARIGRERPDLATAVDNGMTVNAAAVLAGIRPRRISVRLDRPESLAQSLRRHLTAEQLAAVRALLEDP